MDQGEIVVSFKLGLEEARQQTAALQKTASPTKSTIRMQLGLAVLWLVLGTTEVTTNRTRVSGWLYIVAAGFYALLALRLRSQIIVVPSGVDTRLRFGLAGIDVENPAAQTLPWSAVEAVDRYDGALILSFLVSEIKAPLVRRIVIPKDALPDGGIALWHLFEQMLLGPLRRVSPQLSADETGALRRMDASHIENLRARRSKPMETFGAIRFAFLMQAERLDRVIVPRAPRTAAAR